MSRRTVRAIIVIAVGEHLAADVPHFSNSTISIWLIIPTPVRVSVLSCSSVSGKRRLLQSWHALGDCYLDSTTVKPMLGGCNLKPLLPLGRMQTTLLLPEVKSKHLAYIDFSTITLIAL